MNTNINKQNSTINFIKAQAFGNDFIFCEKSALIKYLNFNNDKIFQKNINNNIYKNEYNTKDNNKSHDCYQDNYNNNDINSFFQSEIWKKIISTISHRKFGIGADQLIIFDIQNNIAFMDFFNPDATQAEICLNATIAFTKINQAFFNNKAEYIISNILEKKIDKSIRNTSLTIQIYEKSIYLKDLKFSAINSENNPEELLNFFNLKHFEHIFLKNPKTTLQPQLTQKTTKQTQDTVHNLHPNSSISVQMMNFLNKHFLYATAINIGNPHLLIFFKNLDDIFFQDNTQLLFENLISCVNNSQFFSNGVNIGFVNLYHTNNQDKTHGINHILYKDKKNLQNNYTNNTFQLKTFERGAGWTLGCGSNACAAAFCAYCCQHCEEIKNYYLNNLNLKIKNNIETYNIYNDIYIFQEYGMIKVNILNQINNLNIKTTENIKIKMEFFDNANIIFNGSFDLMNFI